jgi:hypothetical protein
VGVKEGRPTRKADILTAISEPTVGASTAHRPIGLYCLLREYNFAFLKIFTQWFFTLLQVITVYTLVVRTLLIITLHTMVLLSVL